MSATNIASACTCMAHYLLKKISILTRFHHAKPLTEELDSTGLPAQWPDRLLPLHIAAEVLHQYKKLRTLQ